MALITGASSGIGRATTEAFAAKGAKVVVAARRKDDLMALASEIEARGGRPSFVVTDVAVTKDVERMVAHTIETFGRLDYAVNNAAYEGRVASITDYPEEDWDRVLAINLKGAFLCMQHQSRAMLAGGRGGDCQGRVYQLFSGNGKFPGLLRVEAWANRPDDQCVRGIGAQGDPCEPHLSGNH